SDQLDDPFMNDAQAEALGIATADELAAIKQLALRINQLLQVRFAQAELTLVDFKIEVGYLEGQLVLADEISPDSCRLVDATTQASLDKDVFRKHTGDLTTVYQEVLTRLENSEVAHVSR
ncbi:MAG: phosphoribosylaminoimidazolesuccinocarboxamide synthase, partial [Loigolactobacillus coryniformis]